MMRYLERLRGGVSWARPYEIEDFCSIAERRPIVIAKEMPPVIPEVAASEATASRLAIVKKEDSFCRSAFTRGPRARKTTRGGRHGPIWARASEESFFYR